MLSISIITKYVAEDSVIHGVPDLDDAMKPYFWVTDIFLFDYPVARWVMPACLLRLTRIFFFILYLRKRYFTEEKQRRYALVWTWLHSWIQGISKSLTEKHVNSNFQILFKVDFALNCDLIMESTQYNLHHDYQNKYFKGTIFATRKEIFGRRRSTGTIKEQETW